MSERKYYTLVIKLQNGSWAPQYGSYERADCVSERDSYKDRGEKLKDMTIITTSPEQKDIDLRVKELNQPT